MNETLISSYMYGGDIFLNKNEAPFTENGTAYFKSHNFAHYSTPGKHI